MLMINAPDNVLTRRTSLSKSIEHTPSLTYVSHKYCELSTLNSLIFPSSYPTAITLCPFNCPNASLAINQYNTKYFIFTISHGPDVFWVVFWFYCQNCLFGLSHIPDFNTTISTTSDQFLWLFCLIQAVNWINNTLMCFEWYKWNIKSLNIPK